MTMSLFSGDKGSLSGGMSTNFTEEQILIMHANCTMLVPNKDGILHPGFLTSILSNSASVLEPSVGADESPCKEDTTLVAALNKDPKANNSAISEVLEKSAIIKSEIKVSAISLEILKASIRFEKTKLKITNIANRYV